MRLRDQTTSTPGDYVGCACMHAAKIGSRAENGKKIFELKSKRWKRDKIGMGYESLHIEQVEKIISTK